MLKKQIAIISGLLALGITTTSSAKSIELEKRVKNAQQILKDIEHVDTNRQQVNIKIAQNWNDWDNYWDNWDNWQNY